MSIEIHGLSHSMYIDIIVKRFVLEKSKIGLIPMRYRVYVSKEHFPKTVEDRVFMEKISHVSMILIYHVYYATYKTRCDIFSKYYEHISIQPK